uniref:Potassium channel tetramerization domain containing 9b n=1 Tax=Seriola lalandi dorsalis TaxID=1841481 RepID=A0A3B4YN96_SERLL
MRRVTLFVNGTSTNGKVVAVYGSLEDLLTVASSKLGIRASSVYNGNGGLIDDITLIRDDDVLYISEEDSSEDPQDDLRDPENGQTHTDWLTLNVGGRCFTTTRSTLVSKEPESMLAHMFREKDVWGNKQDSQGAYLIDRSPDYFEPILNYLRHGQLIINEGINPLARLTGASQPPEDHSPLTRKEFIRFLLATTTKSELRCQGANLQGVKMLCTNAEGASLRSCNFEDPAGIKANLEGANLKGVDMEGSQMTGINLRVATLKNAKLKSCNLRGATLAGTDLENCDLSGCDLQEANLRGSNVKGAIFEEMLTPLHMSQSVR